MTSLTSARSAQKSKPAQGVNSASPVPRAQEDRTPRLIIQDNGRILYASPALASLLKIKAPSLRDRIARDLMTFTDPGDAQRDRPGLDGIERDSWTSSIVSGEHAVTLAHNGAEISLSLQFDWIALPDGRRYLVASGLPLSRSASKTELKDLVEALVQKKSASRKSAPAPQIFSDALPVFATMTHDLMMLMERDGQLISGNRTFMDTLSYSAEDLAGLNFLDLVHPEDRSHIRSQFKSLMQDEDAADGRMIAFDCRVLARDQAVHWLEWRQKRQDGKIFAVARNLTEIRAHESALIRHQQQLSEAQEIGRMGHWRWHVGNDAIVWSDQIYRIFGRSRDHFQPTLHSVNALLHRRDRGRMAQAFQRAMIEQRDYDMEFRIIRPDGQVRFILLQGRCELDGEGDVTSLYGIMQDITERTQHERELREAKDSAERAYAAKSQFLANMSHELRTPLNAIIGFSEMMQRQLLGPIGTEKYLDYIGGIRESGEHLLDLISDILDMSRIEAGKYELDLEDFNLLKILRLGAHMIEGRALDAQVKILNCVPEDDSLNIVADRRAIMQMILNLLSNAVKFTEPGGEVRIEYGQTENAVTFRITDTGIGIPAGKLKYVTRPFEQVANHFTRNHEGSGLGLSITKELAQLHGGNLQIESEIGTGTSVTITLPRDASKVRRPRSLLKKIR